MGQATVDPFPEDQHIGHVEPQERLGRRDGGDAEHVEALRHHRLRKLRLKSGVVFENQYLHPMLHSGPRGLRR